MRKRLVLFISIIAVIIFFIITIFAFTNINDKNIIKNLILADITNYENTEGANISFGKINITGDKANVDILIDWGPMLCAGYNYKLSKFFRTWKIVSRERTIVC